MASPLHVLVIMSDQHNTRYLGCAGHPIIQTPHIDRLAAEGLRYEHAYCPSPLCGPARMSFLTSLYPHHTGVFANAQPLPSDLPTFAHAFGGGGYDTALIGRMHIVGDDQRHGFEEKICGDVTASTLGGGLMPRAEGLCCGAQSRGLLLSGPGDCSYHHYDDEVADAAVDWISRRKDATRPFMATVGFALPHNPYVCSPEDYALYDGRVTLPPDGRDWIHSALYEQHDEEREGASEEDMLRALTAYCGSVTATDRRVGRILASLENAGLLDNTLVIYTADHGDAAGEHGLWHKSTMYEGSAGVPLIMRGPGVRRGVVSQHVNLVDLAPTMLDMARLTPMPLIDGRSMRCLIEGNTEAWENVTYSEYGIRWGGAALRRMVRRDRWKYVYYDGEGESLFDMEADPQEIHDLAQSPEHQKICDSMRAEAMQGWDPAAINHLLNEREERNRVLFDWMKSRFRDDPELYRGPAGCNRLDLVPEWQPEPERPWDEEVASY